MTWQDLLKRPPPRRGTVEAGETQGAPSTVKIEPLEPLGFDPAGHLVSPEREPTTGGEKVQLKEQVMGRP